MLFMFYLSFHPYPHPTPTYSSFFWNILKQISDLILFCSETLMLNLF